MRNHPLLALVPLELVLADVRAPALLSSASLAMVLADARAPALLAFVPLVMVLADTVLLLLCVACSRCVCLLPSPVICGCLLPWPSCSF